MFRISGSASDGIITTVTGTAGIRVGHTVLSGLRLAFQDRGHQIRAIGAIAGAGQMFFDFRDQDGREPVDWRAFHVSFDGDEVIRAQTYRGDESGDAVVELGSASADEVALLQGFFLEFTDGDDHELSEIQVRLDRSDDGTDDIARLTFYDHDRPDARFNFRLQVVWIRRAAVDGSHEVSSDPGAFELTDEHRPEAAHGRTGLLSGFRYRYVRDRHVDSGTVSWATDSHYIKRFHVDAGQAGPDAAQMSLQLDDGDRDDLSVKEIWFVTL